MTTIGIDARAASEEPAGRGRYVRELLHALGRRHDDHQYILYGRRAWDQPLDERFSWRLRSLRDPAWNVWAGFDASRRSQAFLSTNSYLTAWFTRIPTAIVVHDTIAWEAPASVQRRARWIERATIRPALRRARALICVSESTRTDLVGRFPSARGKATVAPLGATARFRQEQRSERSGFVLCVATLEPRKNLARAIQAHTRLPPPIRRDHPLVIAGARGWEHDELHRSAAAAGVEVVTGPSDDQLADLYAGCCVFLFPSLYEGFGLPLLEAMSAGAACVTSNVSSLPEVGGDAVHYVDPTSVDAIHEAISELLGSPELRRELGEKARARAAGFSWDRTAERVLATMNELASG